MADNSYDLVPPEEPDKNDPAQPKPVRDVPAELQHERTCPHCGFKMYGKLKARCPECAAPMDTVATDILQFSSVDWLRSASTGFLLVLAALIMHLVAAGLRWNPHGAFRVSLHQGAALLMFLAVLKATAREPGPTSQAHTTATIARFASFGSLAFWVPLTLLAWNVYYFKYAMIAFSICVLICQAVLAICLGLYASGLAARVPNDSLATQSTNAGWAVGIACLIMMVLHFLGMTGALILVFCSFPLIGILLAIFLWAATIPIRIASDLRSAAVASETIAYRRAEREAAAAAVKNKKK